MINFSDLFFNVQILPAIKAVLLVAELLYGGFAFVVVRQVSLMNKTFKTNYGGFFQLVAYIHFFTVVAVFALTLLLL